MNIKSRQTNYPWLVVTIESGNTTIEEDIHVKELGDFIEMLEEVISDGRSQQGVG